MKTEKHTSKPEISSQQKAGSDCPETSCSQSEIAYARFFDDRRERLLAYIEARVAQHVEDGGNNSTSYRKDCAYDGMRELPGHSDRDIWNAAWEARLNTEQAKLLSEANAE